MKKQFLFLTLLCHIPMTLFSMSNLPARAGQTESMDIDTDAPSTAPSVGDDFFTPMKNRILQGENPDETDGHGNTPLHWATRRNNIQAAQFFLEHGASVHTLNISGYSPLYIACQQNEIPMARLLLEHGAAETMHSGAINISSILWRQGADNAKMRKLMFGWGFTMPGVQLPLRDKLVQKAQRRIEEHTTRDSAVSLYISIFTLRNIVFSYCYEIGTQGRPVSFEEAIQLRKQRAEQRVQEIQRRIKSHKDTTAMDLTDHTTDDAKKSTAKSLDE